MNRLWLGLVLVALILVSGAVLENRMEKTHHPQAENLERAGDLVRQGDWDGAEALLKQVRKDWEEDRNLAASLVHHSAVDEIDIRFAELEIYAAEKNGTDFYAGIAGLAMQLRNLPKAHGFAWWNLF